MSDKEEPRVYVVQGSSGEYSDRREWLVRAFLDEDAALVHATGVRDGLERLFAEGETWEILKEQGGRMPTDEELDALAALDPTLVYARPDGQRFTALWGVWSPEDLRYGVVSCPVEGLWTK